ncbi:cytochrome P450 [Ktedonosporobacter rubrisoli]|uniref:Cytochrome P450 n=1 Tax=Ktedonosporobacter rubrisoli TaxID=2509675 RepID=A0A4P6JS50_KTERU|nr:cytochrome P450 [Ktedonosporobacter rubrisoli]QBD78145.1 cytochrome P450 [Ktedonosporobacter rubrisoli]
MKQVTMGDFYAPENMRDPIAFSTRLRERQEPLIHLDNVYGMGGGWVVLGYHDAVEILKDPRFIKDMRKFSSRPEPPDTGINDFLAWWMAMPNMILVDPPDHTRLRKLVSKAFTPRMIEGLRSRIQQIADELLDAVQDKGKMDLIADFAFPLPITVILEMLGVPTTDRDQFRAWTEGLAAVGMDPQQEQAAIAALDAFIRYLKKFLAYKREHPGNDLTSGMLQARDQGDTLSENELLSTIWLLITAGHKTTVNLLGNGVLALLQHPEQWRLLQADPALLPIAIEELLRYAGPIIFAKRFASEDLCLHGQNIHKGELVLIDLVAANADPKQFPTFDKLDITREENQHLAFGKGIHHCLGAPLARLEGQVALGTLLRRLPQLRPTIELEQLAWTYDGLRGLVSLPVAF